MPADRETDDNLHAGAAGGPVVHRGGPPRGGRAGTGGTRAHAGLQARRPGARGPGARTARAAAPAPGEGGRYNRRWRCLQCRVSLGVFAGVAPGAVSVGGQYLRRALHPRPGRHGRLSDVARAWGGTAGGRPVILTVVGGGGMRTPPLLSRLITW